ncbi:unnamed protein product [Caenorhabditis bovis]|uniref:glutathione transferase n=1 Tax=Caenorhabditis bovis TaxID=2654633 RepID=A0A8S1EQU3_9PELO|nr:unnamed protein product [Caenorhabditis bovis]
MVQYKLSYFPLRGAAEVIRQIFAVAGKEFEDHRIPREQWPAIKPTTVFGQLPILEVDGKPLAQSHAIARYLAREFGLNGKGAWEEAQVNAVADQFKDYMAEIKQFQMVVIGFAEGDKEKLYKEVFAPAFQKHFSFFKKFLDSAKSGYLVGSSLTWVDLLIANHIETLAAKGEKVLDEFPEFVAHQKLVHSNPNIKKWIETRPETPF